MWALMNLDGSLKAERYTTYEEALEAHFATFFPQHIENSDGEVV